MKKLLIVLTSLGLLSTAVQAAPNPVKNSTNQQGHPYVGVQLGIGGMQTGTTTPDGTKTEVGGLAYRLSGGYLFKINNNFQIGPELGYASYADNLYKQEIGDGSFSKLHSYNSNTIDLLAKAVYSFDSNFSLFGKLGFALVSQTFKTFELTRGESLSSETKSATLPELGLGLGYDFTPQFGMSVSYNTTLGGTKVDPLSFDGSDYAKVANVSTFMVGLNYSF